MTSIKTVQSLNRICRICMKDSVSISNIFTNLLGSSPISLMLMECAPIDITIEDELPKLICSICIVELQNAYKFRLLCVQSDKEIRQILADLKTLNFESTDRSKSTYVTSDDIFSNSAVKVQIEQPIKLERIKTISKVHLYKCQKCNAIFKSSSNFIQHEDLCTFNIELVKKTNKKKYGPNKPVVLPDDDGSFSCKTCSKKFKNKYKLLQHESIHSDFRFRCDVCDRGFTRVSRLKLHEQIHTGEKTYSCEFCGKTFRNPCTLHHHRRIHQQIKPYKCEYCEKCFTQRSTLKKHIRIHTGERPFVCETCGHKFNQKQVLKTHTRLHTGERPYSCELCPLAFISKQKLKIHLTKH